jgi:hypothetical protein
MANFRVIEGGGERRNLKQEFAEQKFIAALFDDVVRAALDFREIAGLGPPSDMLARALAIEDEADEMFAKHASGQIRQESIDRWEKDGTFDEMYAEGTIRGGALQTIASKLLDQSIQVSAGKREMHEGIRRLVAARERHRNYVDANSSIEIVRKKRDRKPRAPLPSKPDQRDE